MARCPGLAQEVVTLALARRSSRARPPALGAGSRDQGPDGSLAGRRRHNTPYPARREPGAGPTQGSLCPLFPMAGAPFKGKAGFLTQHRARSPSTLSVCQPDRKAGPTDWLQRQTPPALQGRGRAGEEPTCRAPPRRAPVRPGNRGAGETPARRAKSPTLMRGTSAFPPAPRAQGRGAGGRRAGPRAHQG